MPQSKEPNRRLGAKPRYTGALALPIWIEPPQIGILNYDERDALRREYAENVAVARLVKFPALFAHYGIDPKNPNSLSLLAWHLASDHVPGFKLAHKRGAPRQRGLDWDLYAEVRLLEIDRGRGVADACEQLAKRKAKTIKKGARTPTGATLRRRFVAAQGMARKIFSDASKWRGETEKELLQDYLRGSKSGQVR